jgi:hypothetical protein
MLTPPLVEKVTIIIDMSYVPLLIASRSTFSKGVFCFVFSQRFWTGQHGLEVAGVHCEMFRVLLSRGKASSYIYQSGDLNEPNAKKKKKTGVFL